MIIEVPEESLSDSEFKSNSKYLPKIDHSSRGDEKGRKRMKIFGDFVHLDNHLSDLGQPDIGKNTNSFSSFPGQKM